MLAYILPLGLVVLANTLYQICAKSVPGDIDPLASLTVTYLVAAAVSLVLYLLLNKHADLLAEYSRLNWAPFVLGLSIIGLEVGYIYAYKAGWPVSSAQFVQSIVVTVLLVFIGFLAYHEALSAKKLLGILVCLAGLALVNS